MGSFAYITWKVMGRNVKVEFNRLSKILRFISEDRVYELDVQQLEKGEEAYWAVLHLLHFKELIDGEVYGDT